MIYCHFDLGVDKVMQYSSLKAYLNDKLPGKWAIRLKNSFSWLPGVRRVPEAIVKLRKDVDGNKVSDYVLAYKTNLKLEKFLSKRGNAKDSFKYNKEEERINSKHMNEEKIKSSLVKLAERILQTTSISAFPSFPPEGNNGKAKTEVIQEAEEELVQEVAEAPVQKAEELVSTLQKERQSHISVIINNMNRIKSCPVIYNGRNNNYGSCAPFTSVFRCLTPFRNGSFCQTDFDTFKREFEQWLSGEGKIKMHKAYDSANKKWLETDEAQTVYQKIGQYCDYILRSITGIDGISKKLESPECKAILEQELGNEASKERDESEKQEIKQAMREERLGAIDIATIKKLWPDSVQEQIAQFERFLVVINYEDEDQVNTNSMSIR